MKYLNNFDMHIEVVEIAIIMEGALKEYQTRAYAYAICQSSTHTHHAHTTSTSRFRLEANPLIKITEYLLALCALLTPSHFHCAIASI